LIDELTRERPDHPDLVAVKIELGRSYADMGDHEKAITVWGLWDGMVWQNNGGLVRADFSRKPAFEVLDSLINREWRTRVATKTDEGGQCVLKGYLGEYEIGAETTGKTLAGVFHLDGGTKSAKVTLK